MDPLARHRTSSSAVQRPQLTAIVSPASAPERDTRSPSRARVGAITSLVLGIMGLVAWIVPWAGFPLGFYGLIEGLRSRYRGTKAPRLALAGIALCALSMTLAVANLVVAAYMGASGKNMFSGILFR